MNKAYYLVKIILIQDQDIILIPDIPKAIYKGQAMVSKINGKVFDHSSFFFINNKRNGKKLYGKIHSISL